MSLVSRCQCFCREYEHVAWWGIAFGFATGTILIASAAGTGNDWRSFYYPAALAGFTNFPGVANPPYIMFLFIPLAILPVQVGNFVLLSLSILSIYTVSRLTDVNKWLLLISFPVWWILWQTQIDAFVLLGVAIGWWAIKEDRPIWQGVATLLLGLKPQVGGPLALLYLVWQRDVRALIISGTVLLASFLAFGFWPIAWVQRSYLESNVAVQGGNFAETITNVGLFPWGIVFWTPLVLPAYTRQQRIASIISATMLSSPYAACYSLLAAMAFPLPVWVYFLISIPFIGRIGYDLAVLAPIAMILYPAITWLWRRTNITLKQKTENAS